MKTILLIREDNHGIIGCATNCQSAICFLDSHGWLKEDTPFQLEGVWHTIKEVFGERNIGYKIARMINSVEKFNECFENRFTLQVNFLQDFDIDNERTAERLEQEKRLDFLNKRRKELKEELALIEEEVYNLEFQLYDKRA